MIRSVFGFLVLLGTLAIAVPWALLVLAFGLVLAFVLITFGFVFGQMLIFGLDTIDEPNSLFGWLGYALCVLTGWALVLSLWAEHFGIARLFARTRDSHGSARLASKAERRDLAKSDKGLLIGRDADSGRLLRYDGPAHLLTLAPTRAGKGVGTVIPNLLLVPRPMLVIDPKGENARITHEARARLGPVHVLDPFGVTGLPSAAYNPLARLAPDSLDLGEDAASLAEALVMDPPGETGDAHWNEEAKALLAGLILFVAVHEAKDRRTLASVREYLTLPPEQFRALLGLMQESPGAGGLIARAANRHLGKADREAAGVLSSAQRHTHFLDSPRIAASLARSDFSFASLRHEVASVFLVLPPNRLDAYSRWLRLLVSQALSEIARDAETAQGAPEAPGAAQKPQEGSPTLREPTLFLLDEFAALGRLEAVERAMGLMAGYGLQLWPILQDLSQLRALYGPRANTFVANAGVLQCFGVNDYETAKALSQLMGQMTTGYTTRSHGSDDNYSITHQLTGRDLLTPDEIMQMSPHLQLLRLQGRPMILARKLRYHADPEFRGLFPPQSAT
ncbi:type IV secretory system conjugative DNA transfer family protein [Paracoccus chinensis]|uniref:Type IV secretion system protein VirD4 n=1 Tax=Paracoccus chinensis TaxID=525640 RepID=A0A1G9NAQ0_9RHOB|nr:type IV secretory system conjugative DNA transfer family protein [Paracoccus chinensis]SDL83509.1 type IV secretion system protein VirD4 [Paracoccus chinensis]